MTSVVDKLMATPKKDKGLEQPHTPRHYPPDYKHQLDLLYLPYDLDKRYALVVVDIGTRKCDAQPMANRKPTDTIRALEAIYKRGILKQPSMLYFDNGTEFKGEFLTHLKNKDILYRVSKTGRHRQTSLVENKNKLIGKALFRRMLEEEMLTGEVSPQWTGHLKEVVVAINSKIKPYKAKVYPNKIEKTPKTTKLLDTIEEVQEEKGGTEPEKEKEPEPVPAFKAPSEAKLQLAINGWVKGDLPSFSNRPMIWNPLTDELEESPIMAAAGAGRRKKKRPEKNTDETYCAGDSCILLQVGTLVRRQLDVPVDYLKEKRLHGTFRATDIRFSKTPQVVSDVVIKPGSPPLYILDNDPTTAYTKNQLQVVTSDELRPSESAIARVGRKKGVETYHVQEILEHKTEKKKKFYLVKWKGFADPTWEPANIIKQDVPDVVKEYEQSLKG